MAQTVTLEQVETLVVQLPRQEQMMLVEHISERLHSMPGEGTDSVEDQARREREADEVLARCDAAAAMWEGEFDAVEDLRKIRAARDEQIWPSK